MTFEQEPRLQPAELPPELDISSRYPLPIFPKSITWPTELQSEENQIRAEQMLVELNEALSSPVAEAERIELVKLFLEGKQSHEGWKAKDLDNGSYYFIRNSLSQSVFPHIETLLTEKLTFDSNGRLTSIEQNDERIADNSSPHNYREELEYDENGYITQRTIQRSSVFALIDSFFYEDYEGKKYPTQMTRTIVNDDKLGEPMFIGLLDYKKWVENSGCRYNKVAKKSIDFQNFETKGYKINKESSRLAFDSTAELESALILFGEGKLESDESKNFWDSLRQSYGKLYELSRHAEFTTVAPTWWNSHRLKTREFVRNNIIEPVEKFSDKRSEDGSLGRPVTHRFDFVKKPLGTAGAESFAGLVGSVKIFNDGLVLRLGRQHQGSRDEKELADAIAKDLLIDSAKIEILLNQSLNRDYFYIDFVEVFEALGVRLPAENQQKIIDSIFEENTEKKSANRILLFKNEDSGIKFKLFFNDPSQPDLESLVQYYNHDHKSVWGPLAKDYLGIQTSNDWNCPRLIIEVDNKDISNVDIMKARSEYINNLITRLTGKK